jgi:selenide,water dikinase
MKIRLTQTVQKGGCAAKISAEVLRETLGSLDFTSADPAVMIDGRDFDDAGIYRVSDEVALVQTLDFFTPIVDTPELFGAIASANALSDVYAMGGVPKTCMAILAFPLATLDPVLMREVLEGARKKIAESGSTLVGGHSIDDDTLKFGLSVTGFVHPSRIWSNAGSRPGDQLILTKALGTGTLTAGLKNQDYDEDGIHDALDSMCQLNSIPDLLDEEEKNWVHSATDITGFGIAGHLQQMSRASGHAFHLRFRDLPVFEKTFASLHAENLTKAHRSNESYTRSSLHFDCEPDPIEKKILFDPQTSGGLLLSVPAEKAKTLMEKIQTRFPRAAIVGEVLPSGHPGTPEIRIHG